MNVQKVREILRLYKDFFPQINRQEIYKWQIVKWFQDRWNIDAQDFYSMLDESLRTSANLLASGTYYPLTMLRQNTAKSSEEMRELFAGLFDESSDLLNRIYTFRSQFNRINERFYPGTKSFQDHRAVLVYLNLRYPNIYYLYKYEMFKDFVDQVDYFYEPKQGRIENVTQYLTLCNLLREEIVQDAELLSMHKSRIGDQEYAEDEFHILTQDVIYAAYYHLPRMLDASKLPPASARLRKVERTVKPTTYIPTLKGSFTNYIELERERKRIGDMGEMLVLEW